MAKNDTYVGEEIFVTAVDTITSWLFGILEARTLGVWNNNNNKDISKTKYK